MNKILIWEDILKELLKTNLKNQVMFGIQNCTRNAQTSEVHDFLFHLQNVNIGRVTDDDFWVVPVIPYEEDKEKRHDLVRRAYQRNPLIDTVAVKSRGAVYHEKHNQGRIEFRPHLEIYRIDSKQTPIIVPGYDPTNDQEMGRIVKNWADIKKTLDNFRVEIKEKYS